MGEPHAVTTPADAYATILFDCDGVLYLRDQVIAAAPAALSHLRALGRTLAFVTNNASVSPASVAAKLARFGVDADAGEVTTSSQAAVAMLGGAEKLTGVRVLAVGGPGLHTELNDAGAALLSDDDDWRDATVVAVGFTPDLTYDQLRRACLAITAGARFVGTNPDVTLPTPDGPWPGAGATLALLRAATGRDPEVAGKPEPPMLLTAAARGNGPYLMVGDRADTDLDGAVRLGWDTALVLTGVTPTERLLDLTSVPTYLLRDVGGLTAPLPPAVRAAAGSDHAAAARLMEGNTPAGAAGGTGSRTLVATDVAGEHPGRVVGALTWSLVGELAILHGPIVTAPARGSLTGTRLVLSAAVAARAAGARKLVLHRLTAAGAFFPTRLGFRPAGEAQPPGSYTRPLSSP